METKLGIEINRKAMSKINRAIVTCKNQEQLEVCIKWIGKIFDTEAMEYGWMHSVYLQRKADFITQENKVFKRPLENLSL
jgi:hypothetical protein